MLRTLALEESGQWDAIVRSFQDYDVYYLSGYVKAFALHGDGEPILFHYEGDGLRGINVVMRRDVAKDPRFADRLPEAVYYDFATPYGYGGWLMEGEGDKAALFDAYGQWCAEHRIVSEFVRYHPVLDNWRFSAGYYDTSMLGSTIAMDLTSPEVVRTNLTSKNRNMIRKAIKAGLAIKTGKPPEVAEVFRNIYNRTMDRDGAEAYYYFEPEFYKSVLVDDLPDNSEVFRAELPDGTVVAASILIWAGSRLNYHLSGTMPEHRNLAPSNLLLYEAALWGCQKGFKTFHLGGGVGASEDNLYRFKRAFNRRDDLKFHVGRRVLDPKAYGELVALRRGDPNFQNDSSFFPLFRA